MGLVLSRKLNESIIFDTSDGPIEVKVITNSNGKVKLLSDAPRSVTIRRKELPEGSFRKGKAA